MDFLLVVLDTLDFMDFMDFRLDVAFRFAIINPL